MSNPAEWLKAQGHGFLANLARTAGLSYNTVHEIFNAKRRASPRSMIAIELATDGEITARDLMALTVIRPKRPTARTTKRRRRATARPIKRSRPKRTRARAA